MDLDDGHQGVRVVDETSYAITSGSFASTNDTLSAIAFRTAPNFPSRISDASTQMIGPDTRFPPGEGTPTAGRTGRFVRSAFEGGAERRAVPAPAAARCLGDGHRRLALDPGPRDHAVVERVPDRFGHRGPEIPELDIRPGGSRTPSVPRGRLGSAMCQLRRSAVVDHRDHPRVARRLTRAAAGRNDAARATNPSNGMTIIAVRTPDRRARVSTAGSGSLSGSSAGEAEMLYGLSREVSRWWTQGDSNP